MLALGQSPCSQCSLRSAGQSLCRSTLSPPRLRSLAMLPRFSPHTNEAFLAPLSRPYLNLLAVPNSMGPLWLRGITPRSKPRAGMVAHRRVPSFPSVLMRERDLWQSCDTLSNQQLRTRSHTSSGTRPHRGPALYTLYQPLRSSYDLSSSSFE